MITKLLVVLCCIIVLVWAWRILVWVWIRPKKLEKCLRQQGFKGNSYKLLFGDLKEFSKKMKEAKSSPINLSHAILPRAMPFIHESFTKYGKNCFIWIGPTPRVFIMDPELVRDVLNKYYIFQKPKSNPLVRLLAKGLASLEGEKWATHRKIINPAFHAEKLKHMLPAFYLSCSDIMSKWEKMISTNRSFEVDVWPYLETLTSDAISRTSFGSSYEEGRKIFQLQKEQAALAIQAALSVYIPGWRYWPSKRNKRMKEIDKEVKFLLKSIIDKKMKSMDAGETNSDDLLGILLESNLKEIQKNRIKNLGMSIEEVIEECKLFYFAGQETTSVLLVWTMIVLSMHPNWQTRAREEVLQAFGNEKPDLDGLNRLKIVNMILYEVLRLYSPLVLINRSTHKDIKLGEMFLPSGVQVTLPIMLIHRDNDIWGDDANDFKPERFSEGVSKATKNQASFFPFSGGPRICIGQSFAMLEAKVSLSMILQRFSFELSPSYTHDPSPIITLQPQYGAPLILHKI